MKKTKYNFGDLRSYAHKTHETDDDGKKILDIKELSGILKHANEEEVFQAGVYLKSCGFNGSLRITTAKELDYVYKYAPEWAHVTLSIDSIDLAAAGYMFYRFYKGPHYPLGRVDHLDLLGGDCPQDLLTLLPDGGRTTSLSMPGELQHIWLHYLETKNVKHLEAGETKGLARRGGEVNFDWVENSSIETFSPGRVSANTLNKLLQTRIEKLNVELTTDSNFTFTGPPRTKVLKIDVEGMSDDECETLSLFEFDSVIINQTVVPGKPFITDVGCGYFLDSDIKSITINQKGTTQGITALGQEFLTNNNTRHGKTEEITAFVLQ